MPVVLHGKRVPLFQNLFGITAVEITRIVQLVGVTFYGESTLTLHGSPVVLKRCTAVAEEGAEPIEFYVHPADAELLR